MIQPLKYYEDDITSVAVANIRPFQITATNPEKPNLHPLSIVTIKRVTNRMMEFIRAGSVRKIGDKYFYTGFDPARLQVHSLKILPNAMKPKPVDAIVEAPKKPRVTKRKEVQEEEAVAL